MKLGAQLYTLRDYTQNEKDLDYSLAAVAKMGYTTVQLSAIGPIAPEKVRALCDKHSLEIVLTHTNPDRIMNDTAAVIAEHEVYGCRYIGIGGMPQRYRSAAWIEHFAMDYKEAAKKIAAAGKLLMYHNHNFEFMRMGEKRLLDYVLEGFGPEELGVTLDTYWVQAAGGDVAEWIGKLKGRLPCVHLKDMAVTSGETMQLGAMAPVMEGNMNFPAILDALKAQGGTKYLLVEQDICDESPFVCLQKSYSNLAKLSYH